VRTLVVAPHPDDEVLGCGGTLLRHRAEGQEVGWLIVTSVSEDYGWTPERVRSREAEIERVAAAFDFTQVFNLRFPSTQLDQIPAGDLVARFSEVFRDFRPEEVLLPNRDDAHSDHRASFDAAAACCKWFRYPFVRRVLAYETLSETEFALGPASPFQPNTFVDISAYLERKLEIMRIYASELEEAPFPRSAEAIRSLASLRGSTAGYAAAEAFQLLRERR
jgi:LmbE family N-acetylglucosaminyl deacetylase